MTKSQKKRNIKRIFILKREIEAIQDKFFVIQTTMSGKDIKEYGDKLTNEILNKIKEQEQEIEKIPDEIIRTIVRYKTNGMSNNKIADKIGYTEGAVRYIYRNWINGKN